MKNDTREFAAILASTVTHEGDSLGDVCSEGKTLLVFLRQGGCTFCREALEDIRRRRADIENAGTRVVLVHMMNDREAAVLLKQYDLSDVPRVSDPDRALYRAFGLEQGRLKQLLGWKMWWRGFIAGIIHRHGAGRLSGDGRQMPGVFLLDRGEIVRAFRHRTAADRPDYAAMATCTIGARSNAAHSSEMKVSIQ